MPLLEIRRIHAAGGSLAVTLPPGWLAYFGIEAGDEVQIVANGELTIKPLKNSKENTVKDLKTGDGQDSYC